MTTSKLPVIGAWESGMGFASQRSGVRSQVRARPRPAVSRGMQTALNDDIDILGALFFVLTFVALVWL